MIISQEKLIFYLEKNKRADKRGFLLMSLSGCIILFILLIIFYDIFSHGGSNITWEFLTSSPKNGMKEGGIGPAILGTVYVTIISTILAIPLGILAAVYLSEYARNNFLSKLVTNAVRNLAGVPSIVYGLFGLSIFIDAFGMKSSLLVAGLTLSILVLPYIIITSYEAFKLVPSEMREASYALGATKWITIFKIVLPQAFSQIITGIILSISRAAGETAPIIFTGVVFYKRGLPDSIWDNFMALPYHIFTLSTEHPSIAKVKPLAYSTALILLCMIFILNIFAIWLRNKLKIERN